MTILASHYKFNKLYSVSSLSFFDFLSVVEVYFIRKLFYQLIDPILIVHGDYWFGYLAFSDKSVELATNFIQVKVYIG